MSDSKAVDYEALAVESFKKFLRFPTVSNDGPSGVYQACVDWLAGYCTEAGFSVDVKTFVEGKPVLIATLVGSDPSAESVFLNCHYDVGMYAYVYVCENIRVCIYYLTHHTHNTIRRSPGGA
jgi:acetylornithine deacetylase/succinyl-diaminopimelate desuccinylase-like protein